MIEWNSICCFYIIKNLSIRQPAPAIFKYYLKLSDIVSKIAIIENSSGLAEFFTKFLDKIEYEIFPVWKTPVLPKNDFQAYFFTGDFNNISDGLSPVHKAEIEFTKSIENEKIFGSCFFHQLISMIYGGLVGKRETRFLGWYKMVIEKNHPIFNGLKEPYFLNLNIDEIVKMPNTGEVLATNPECKYQVIQYGEHILTCQSHPEILLQEGLDSIREHREGLLDHCPELDKMVRETKDLADDDVNEKFLSNIIAWLVS